MPRTALDGYVLGDAEKNFLLGARGMSFRS